MSCIFCLENRLNSLSQLVDIHKSAIKNVLTRLISIIENDENKRKLSHTFRFPLVFRPKQLSSPVIGIYRKKRSKNDIDIHFLSEQLVQKLTKSLVLQSNEMSET